MSEIPDEEFIYYDANNDCYESEDTCFSIDIVDDPNITGGTADGVYD